LGTLQYFNTYLGFWNVQHIIVIVVTRLHRTPEPHTL
jgi:hypothetical protein